MKIFFIGICGTATGNVAILMQRLGYTVSGSDTGMYEPMKSALAGAGVAAHEGWSPERLAAFNPDLVVVGNAISRMNPELEFVLANQYDYTSLPALIGDKLIGTRRSLVVSGTHGKTTTTTIASYLLRKNGIDAGWLIGGIPRDLPEGGSNLGDIRHAPFVIEGDEYDSAFFDKRSKFIHYKPRVLLINNMEFDHADIFRDLIDVKRTFTHVRRVVSPLGVIVENGDDENIRTLEETPWCERICVGESDRCHVRISDFVQSGGSSSFRITYLGDEKRVEWNMQGMYNARNAAMAIVGASLIAGGQPLDVETRSLSRFKGVKRRQETILDTDKIIAVEDFAHHPTAIALTIESLRQKYPGRKIYAAFEPRSNTAKTRILQDAFFDALSTADRVYVGAVNASKLSASDRMDTAKMAAQNPGKFQAFQRNTELLQTLEKDIADEQNKCVCAFFSNGSFDNIHKEFASKFA